MTESCVNWPYNQLHATCGRGNSHRGGGCNGGSYCQAVQCWTGSEPNCVASMWTKLQHLPFGALLRFTESFTDSMHSRTTLCCRSLKIMCPWDWSMRFFCWQICTVNVAYSRTNLDAVTLDVHCTLLANAQKSNSAFGFYWSKALKFDAQFYSFCQFFDVMI